MTNYLEFEKLNIELRYNEFNKILENIANDNYLKFLENIFFEEEYGCWILISNVYGKNYPKKIYKYVDEKITNYDNVRYFISGSQVESFPNINDLIKLFKYSDETFKVCIDNVATYQYNFSDKFLYGNNTNTNIICKIIYSILSYNNKK